MKAENSCCVCPSVRGSIFVPSLVDPDGYSPSTTPSLSHPRNALQLESYFATMMLFHGWKHSFLFYTIILDSPRGTQSLLLFPKPYSSADNFKILLSATDHSQWFLCRGLQGPVAFWPFAAMETTVEVHGSSECFKLVLPGAQAANCFSLVFPQSF